MSSQALPREDDNAVSEEAIDRPCRIALVSETWPPEINGVANSLNYLAHELAGRGDQVLVIRPRQRRAGDDPRPAASPIRHVLMPGLPLPGYRGLRFGLPARRRLKRHLRDWQPDAVYIATQGPLGHSALNAARQAGIPVTTGFHSNFHQYGSHYGLARLQPLIWHQLRRFHRRGQLTLAPTRELGNLLTDQGFGPTAVLERGVDSERFSPAHRSPALRRHWGITDDSPVLLHVGRLAAEKNLPLALATWQAARQRYPDTRLVLVGDGPLRPSLEQAYPEVIFAGARRGLDLSRHYASADILLVPSLTETFGNVTLEGMASGLGVVCFDYAAGARHVQDRVSGRLVPPGDETAYINAGLAWLDHHEELARCRNAARDHARSLQWQAIAGHFRSYLLNQEVNPHG